tara:strand:- start:1451 stop:1942 length:492 start_codon:yes stop_codon:yes gene_type:complete
MNQDRIYFSLGSNLGDRKYNLQHALMHLNSKLEIDLISSVYETTPQGFIDQFNFYNLVCSSINKINAHKLLRFCQEIEIHCGRKPNFINGPRTVDIDIISYGQRILAKEELVIPHPRMHSRLFVLIPLSEINPHWEHPELEIMIDKLIESNTNQGQILNIGKL